MAWQTIQLRQPNFAEVFATISAHFLTQKLPDDWEHWATEYLEEWFVECAVYEEQDWFSVYKQIERITDDILKLYKVKRDVL